MVKELVIYPDERIHIASTDVRKFDEELEDVLKHMKDTMEANNLEALSAIQIAYPYNIVLIKHDGKYLEFINPRILKTEGKIESKEKTAYYPNTEVTVTRYKKIKLIYEDRKGNPKHMDIDDEKLSVTLQRKIDYLFGGTVLDKLPKEKREEVIKSLKDQGYAPNITESSVCPTFTPKDYFVSFNDKVLFFAFLGLFAPLFSLKPETLSKIFAFEKIAFFSTFILMIGYFVYGQFDAKKYKQCTSCQIGNMIGVMAKRVAVAAIIFTLSYFIFK